MGLASKIKGLRGQVTAPTLTTATTIVLPPEYDTVYLSGTATVTALLTDMIRKDREVTIRIASGTATMTNTNDATTAGEMDLGGSNLAMAANDVLKLMQQSTGAWVRSGVADN